MVIITTVWLLNKKYLDYDTQRNELNEKPRNKYKVSDKKNYIS